ncbi:hypothetical protein BC629DRAFT_1589529 [Irpex lacteus]|nr:hypothetical protein BC629DRAFT_1589529 [Irpex lacteus]
MSATSTPELTAEKIAQQFGLGSEHGQYAWRVMLNSPLDAERCQGIVSTLAREDVIPHRRKPTADEEGLGEPFPKVDPTSSVVRAPPSPVIADFAQTHGPSLINACLSHLNEPPYVAFSPQARPLFALLKEVSYLDDVYSGLLSEGGVGKKVYSAFLRAVGRLVGDGGWVGGVGCVVDLDEDTKYTNFGAQAPLDVLTILLLILPILLNTIAALAPEGIPVQHPKSAENVRGVLKETGNFVSWSGCFVQ